VSQVGGFHPFLFHRSHAEQDRRAIARRARLRESPSAGSKLHALLDSQCRDREDVIYNHRPHFLTGPPIQIYNPAFATFVREMSHPCSKMEFTPKELGDALEFINVSLDFYKDESFRRDKIHSLRVLGDLTSPEVKFDSRTIKPDGTVTIYCPASKQEAIVRIVEMKNEIGEGSSDPIAQAECGFVLICSSEKVTLFLATLDPTEPLLLQYKRFTNASCCPMFLVGVAGPHLAISGAIFAERLVSQRLTDYIYLGPLPALSGTSALDHSIRRVAQVFRALNQATKELEDYYSKLEFDQSQISHGPQKSHGPPSHGSSHPPPTPSHPITPHPVPPSFQGFTVDERTYKVDYRSRLGPASPSRAVFKGTITCSSDQVKHIVAIKFTATYCVAAHKKLAEIDRAPRLWFCDLVESVGMYVVVMDYEDTGERLVEGKHIEELRTAIKALHGGGYVHGDIRGPNVLVTTGGLKLIDFDWCGEEGTARYPADICLTAGYPWHKEVCRGGQITKDHDEHMLTVLTREVADTTQDSNSL
jgi:hypothetical protein